MQKREIVDIFVNRIFYRNVEIRPAGISLAVVNAIFVIYTRDTVGPGISINFVFWLRYHAFYLPSTLLLNQYPSLISK